MCRLISVLVFLLVTTPVLSMQNSVTDSDNCVEFEEQALYYYEKASEKDLYSEKYEKIANNFKKMYLKCLEETEMNNAYPGYRDNVIQQKQTDEMTVE